MASDMNFGDLEKRMRGALHALEQEFSGLRTGRANASLLDPLTVDAYGGKLPVSQVGTVGVPEPRLITVQVWDQGLVSAVEKAIRDSDLGLNPSSDGQLVRIPIPELNEERRVELGKIASKYAEQARVAARNVRRDGMDALKQMEKKHEIGEDEHRQRGDEIQKLTDSIISAIDESLHSKESDIMQV